MVLHSEKSFQAAEHTAQPKCVVRILNELSNIKRTKCRSETILLEKEISYSIEKNVFFQDSILYLSRPSFD